MNKSSHQSISTGLDRISDLPDSILCHILYSFPTKFAASTSVLSKRWEQVWLSVYAFDFDSRDFKNSNVFCHAIYSTMDRRDNTLPIHSFRVKYHDDIGPSCHQKDVNQFVQRVMQRGIQIFDLNLSKYDRCSVKLPVTILSCRTLEVLKLTNLKVGSIPDEVDLHLPSLKTLHLNKVDFERYRDLVSLVLNCPILEDFETTYCFVFGLHQRFVNLPVIPNLIKARISEFQIPLFAISKAKFLRVELGMFTCCEQLLMFHSLTHLELNFEPKLGSPRWTWLLGMLKFCPKLQHLIIKDNVALEETNDEYWKNPSTVPECLLSQLKTCHIRDYKGKQYDLEFAKYIIENSKVLDTMTINSTCSLDTEAKQQLLMKLSSCTRGSPTCKLLFD